MMLLGTALLAVIVHETDLSEVWQRLHQVGFWGVAVILAVYLLGFVARAGSWLLTLLHTPVTPLWLYRLWKVLMFGCALESATPFGGLGGEPVKAIVLKRRYGIRVRDATASLVLARTTDVMAQVAFIAAGFALMFRAEILPLPYRLAAASGLVLFTAGVALFFVAQRRRALTRIHRWLDEGWLAGRSLSREARRALDSVHDVEDSLVAFYARARPRFALSVLTALAEWLSGAVATWLAVNFLGHPISFLDAIVIESFVVLVRSALFFVPADIGTQEGAQGLICAAITGSPALGLALATIRRAGDILWIVWGLAIGSFYSFARADLAEAAVEVQAARAESADRPA
jgi:uncharacterized protein (TIRG00374 family)